MFSFAECARQISNNPAGNNLKRFTLNFSAIFDSSREQGKVRNFNGICRMFPRFGKQPQSTFGIETGRMIGFLIVYH